ncbi:MAG: carbamoyl-phosphate synthase large subunit [Polyangiaceae bacterium]|nr:carbamoyl-phosphate synthase large subunit [Polyangiaceae bacterium]
MPRRKDLRKIVLIGSGPIVIGQACEFDYSGVQGAKALREEGYEVVLVNSNPATIMTDPEYAERTYIEPLDPGVLAQILERERPDALLPTLGGQTALNLALALVENGTLERLGVELLGANAVSIRKAEDRRLFKEAMERIGLPSPRSGYARSVEDARALIRETTGLPAILRPSFTMGGAGGGVIEREDQIEARVAWALACSPTREVLVEESLLGWKEFELEVIRDNVDNFIVVCTIENVDPMGVHTGDSITVAPAMTLTDREYQRLRDAARAIMTEIGVETGGSNVQFAVDPKDGRFVVIEMNPRVSRSSALASKATGYPIAKVAAKLAVGYRLDELRNDITLTSAAFEPVIDYVVVKWPRFTFEKFPGADARLGTQMKSVGEVMAIGRTFPEALQKAARSLETGKDGLVSLEGRVDYVTLAERSPGSRDLAMDAPESPAAPRERSPATRDELRAALRHLVPEGGADRLFYVADALRFGVPADELYRLTGIDPWFLHQIGRIVAAEGDARALAAPAAAAAAELDAANASAAAGHEDLAVALRRLKRLGFSDRQLGSLTGLGEGPLRQLRQRLGVRPSFARVDTCAAEFVAHTPYLYATYESESEAAPTERRKIIILGGGPNRIGQGIEFDYCCVHAVAALREVGVETVMVNCNPETVSTDYDTADRLYFEPLTLEDVLAICDEEKPEGVIVQFGGQTPLKLAVPLARAGVKILGTSADAIDRAEDRERFDALLGKLGMRRPRGGIAKDPRDAFRVAESIGFPVLVRPSYVLGGRAMMICHDRTELGAFMHLAEEAAREAGSNSVLIDEFLKDAIEVDVDCLADGRRVVIGGVMQHVEEAGVHSGDSTSVLPPHSLPVAVIDTIEDWTRKLALELGVLGLMNVQFAVKGDEVFVLEVNPRASRTVPFVSKATGRPLAKLAAKLIAGLTLDELGAHDLPWPRHVSVKESVFPFSKFPGVDTILGPEMRSTGEVMGIAPTFARAYGKSLLAAGVRLPATGRVFLSVKDDDKPFSVALARRLRNLGFDVVATAGTAEYLRRARVQAEPINKVAEGSPHIVDAIRRGTIALVINTSVGAKSIRDSFAIRRQTLLAGIPYFTTMSAALEGVAALEVRGIFGDVCSIQEWHARA